MIDSTSMVLAGGGVNFAYAVTRHQDFFPGLLAAGMLTIGCAWVSDFSPALGTSLAALYLLTSMLLHGAAVVGLLAGFTTGKAK